MENNYLIFLLFFGVILELSSTQFLNNKPWPKYSLQNMPRTSFTCRDKILGGYYADSETQCQMFHVCVKVAGVGVQDFRFLCPNGTAFDQEAQTCADWGDVDCEQATLYYGSDNFDLYRIGSGFESKRAPFAEEEEEATFHLQRAETGDSRRSKQTVVNQSQAPDKISLYNGKTQSRSSLVLENQLQYQPKLQNQNQLQRSTTIAKPITRFVNSYNQPQETTKKVFHEKSTTVSYTNVINDNQSPKNLEIDSSKDNDEIFKGSHSSNFFNNRNNGKEDDFDDFKEEISTTSRPHIRGRQRGRNNYRNSNANNIYTNTKTISSTTVPSTHQPSPTPFIQTSTKENYKNTYNTATPQQKFSYKEQLNPSTIFEEKSTLGINYPTNTAINKQTNPTNIGNKQFVSDNINNKNVPTIAVNNNKQQTYSTNIISTSTTTNPNKPVQSLNPINYFSTIGPVITKKPLQDPFKVTYIQPNANQNNQFSLLSSTILSSTESPKFQLRQQDQVYKQKANSNAQQINNQYYENNQFKSIAVSSTELPSENIQLQPNNERVFQQIKITEQNNQYNFNNKHQTTKLPPIVLSTEKSKEIRVPLQFRSYQNQYDKNNLNSSNYTTKLTTSTVPLDYTKPESKIITQNGDNNNNNRNQYRRREQSRPSSNLQQEAYKNPVNNKKESRTLLASFGFEPNPTTYNPQSNYKQNQLTPFNSTPRGFSQQQISETTPKSSTISNRPISNRLSESHTPSTVKKFSTLVPKDLYNPTTFKPTTYKKSIDASTTVVNKQFNSNNKNTAFNYAPTKTAAPSAQSAPNSDDEDDGQYRPELYEQDFVKNKLKSRNNIPQYNLNNNFNDYNSYQSNSKSYNSNEDEVLNTAHSQNIAASGNELRLAEAKKASPKPFSKAPTIPPNATSTKKPAVANKDASYDYAYYDTSNDNTHDYSEYGIIDFGKTKTSKKH